MSDAMSDDDDDDFALDANGRPKYMSAMVPVHMPGNFDCLCEECQAFNINNNEFIVLGQIMLLCIMFY